MNLDKIDLLKAMKYQHNHSLLILVVFWFLIIRPQQKKQKEHTRMVNSLKKGDNVVTNGGIFGTITKVRDDRISLEVASKINIEIEPVPQNKSYTISLPESCDSSKIISYNFSGVNASNPILSIFVDDLVNKPTLLYFTPSIP